MHRQNRDHFPIVRIQVSTETDIVVARQRSRSIAAVLGFDEQDQSRLATAVSELARNCYQYAGGGTIEFAFQDKTTPQEFVIRVTDTGPGIGNVEEILNGQYVSKTGMGVGLIGSKKLVDRFEIETVVPKGTSIFLAKALPLKAKRLTRDDLSKITTLIPRAVTASPFDEIQQQNRDLVSTLEQLRRNESELNDLNRELAETNRGVVALYAELDEKAASLQRANEVKTSFLSNMTHEFRTPLSSIISLTRMLQNRIDGDLTTEQEKQVHYIRSSAESLLELVSDLLDLAKVEAGKITINPAEFTIEDLMGTLRGVFRPILGNDSPIDLRFEPAFNGELVTDESKVSQVLRNLIANAIKYTENGSIIVDAKADDGGYILFSVKDTGIGIEKEDLEKIFEDFGQVDSKLQRRTKGTGLGLPLSRKLCRLLGGDLWVESSPGEGSIFFARIPREYVGESEGVLFDHKDHAGAAGRRTEEADQSRFTVLLVDDDEPSRYILRSLIGAEIKSNFHEALNGREGLEKIKKLSPDVVFLDLSMPEMDGFEVLNLLKLDPAISATPIIVNTAKKLTPDEEAFLIERTVAILSKEQMDSPVALGAMKAALKSAGFDYSVQAARK